MLCAHTRRHSRGADAPMAVGGVVAPLAQVHDRSARGNRSAVAGSRQQSQASGRGPITARRTPWEQRGPSLGEAPPLAAWRRLELADPMARTRPPCYDASKHPRPPPGTGGGPPGRSSGNVSSGNVSNGGDESRRESPTCGGGGQPRPCGNRRGAPHGGCGARWGTRRAAREGSIPPHIGDRRQPPPGEARPSGHGAGPEFHARGAVPPTPLSGEGGAYRHVVSQPWSTTIAERRGDVTSGGTLEGRCTTTGWLDGPSCPVCRHRQHLVTRMCIARHWLQVGAPWHPQRVPVVPRHLPNARRGAACGTTLGRGRGACASAAPRTAASCCRFDRWSQGMVPLMRGPEIVVHKLAYRVAHYH